MLYRKNFIDMQHFFMFKAKYVFGNIPLDYTINTNFIQKKTCTFLNLEPILLSLDEYEVILSFRAQLSMRFYDDHR